MEDQKTNKLIVPIAIILAGIIISGAIFYDKKTPSAITSKDTFNEEIWKTVKPFELNESKIEQLMKWCDLENIEFGCSIFDEERFLKLDKMCVKKHKLASRVSKYYRTLA